MVVQHNLTAMNSNRMLGMTQAAQAKSSEKLSSGYQINRAADDAAGLSISEKMRKQINGLDKAATNAQDGVSAVQTAEGALTEVHSMLQRMNELAVQAANGTNSASDRDAIQAEIDQLTTEIDRVAETTKFNETYLLKGDGKTSTNYVAAHDAGLAGKLGESVNGKTTFTLDKALEDGDKVTIAGKEYTIGSTTANTDGYKDLTTLGGESFGVGNSIKTATDGKTHVLVDKAVNGTDITLEDDDVINIDGVEYTIDDTNGTDLSNGTLSVADAGLKITEALEKGQEAYLTTTAADRGVYAANDKVKVQFVTGLDTADDNVEHSSVGITANTALTADDFAGEIGGPLAAGDVVTIDDTAIEATAKEPVTMDTVKDVVKELKVGDAFTISDAAATSTKTITIAEQTSIGKDEYTIEDALALINDKDTVNFATVTSAEGKSALTVNGLKAATDYTAVESKVVSDDANVISKTDAYNMMAEELAKASSIGTDAGKGATVTSNNSGTFTIEQGRVDAKESLNFNLHVGADADMTNKITIDIETMSTANLGIKGISVAGENGANATYAIDAIADAISKVSAQRSALGAVQNRLEHTIANLDNVVENTTAAESRIRDTDMAEEMVEFSKNNILAQAGQSMLAQANQSTQGVLSLLG